MDAVTRTTLALAAATLLASAAHAEQFWVAYEGDVLPEDAGWTRYHGYDDSEAVRWIEDGALVIDSRADTQLYDYVSYAPSTSLVPGSGETFVAQWRVLVEETLDTDYADVSVWVSAMGPATAIRLSTDVVFYADGDITDRTAMLIAPGEWHAFELRTSDMQTYELIIDGTYVALGDFGEYFPDMMEMSFGDTVIGASSLSRWDYVRFGVVPEPTSAALLLAGVAATAIRRPIRRRRA